MHALGQDILVADDLGAAIGGKALVAVAEILHIAAGEYRAADRRWLHRVLSALGIERAADKCDFGQAQVEAHFADRVAEQDIRVGRDRVLARTAGDLQACSFSSFSISSARSGWRGTMMVRRPFAGLRRWCTRPAAASSLSKVEMAAHVLRAPIWLL